jgi:iron(III) transport system ATP-binding protein
MLELTAISKSFSDVQVLDSLNLSVAPGSRTAIVGPSGSGKTTLLRILAGFETPDTGRIVMQGRTLFDENHFVPAHLRGIGFVPQEGALFPPQRGRQHCLGLDGTRHEKRQRVEALMEMVSLDRQLATHWPHEISGGQQQRVALARALAQRPSLMLLDEPFSALDTGLRAMTRKATADLLAEAGVASILVTHDQNEALSFATQVAVMRSGRFTQVGTPYDVYTRPVDEETALFLGDAVILPAQLAGGLRRVCTGRGADGQSACNRRGPGNDAS